MVLDRRHLASMSDLSSLHAMQAGLVWVCSVAGRSGLGSLRGLQEALVDRAVGQVAVRRGLDPVSIVQSQSMPFITAMVAQSRPRSFIVA